MRFRNTKGAPSVELPAATDRVELGRALGLIAKRHFARLGLRWPANLTIVVRYALQDREGAPLESEHARLAWPTPDGGTCERHELRVALTGRDHYGLRDDEVCEVLVDALWAYSRRELGVKVRLDRHPARIGPPAEFEPAEPVRLVAADEPEPAEDLPPMVVG